VEQKHSLFCLLTCMEATTNKTEPSEHSLAGMYDIPLFRLQCFVRKRIMYPFMDQSPHHPMLTSSFSSRRENADFR